MKNQFQQINNNYVYVTAEGNVEGNSGNIFELF